MGAPAAGTIDTDDEIVRDFLVEAGEIIERLGEELVELEERPDDAELLNAIFRGFHTVKGGAGFLGVEAMVELCHRAEDAFNLVRAGELAVGSGLMDTMLAALDSLQAMFAEVGAARVPPPAPPALVRALDAILAGEAPAPPVSTGALDAGDPPAADASDEAQAPGAGASGVGEASAAAPAHAVGEEITEAEFEALLDTLHGPGRAPGAAPPAAPAVEAPAAPLVEATAPEAPAVPTLGEGPAASSARPAASADSTVRVPTGVLDRIMNMVGELVLARNRIATLEGARGDEEMAKAVGNLDVVTSDLQSAVMRTRMQPIRKVFGRFPRVVRDLAHGLGKEVELVLEGEDTDLDKNLVEALADPLVHLVRNAIDHGIESPDERVAAGKPRHGQVRLAAEQLGDQILLTIADDGRGMDPEALRRKIVENGVMDADGAARLSEHECFQLVFAPGFSTKTEISEVSGRGVGMDVVKSRITQLNGHVDIESQKGAGSRILIKVPLTLAIVPTLMVVLGRQIFALPLVNVREIFDFDGRRTNFIDGQLSVVLRGKPLPLFYLTRWLAHGAGDARPRGGHVVVVHAGNRIVGFVVDELIGQEEVVIKPLGALLHGTRGLAGATITGDGRIALILDAPGLLGAYAARR